MRVFVVAGLLFLGASNQVLAQQCETMVVRNDAGVVVSNSVMCLDADGFWTPRAAINAAAVPQQATPGAQIGAPAAVAAPKPVAPPKRIAAPKPVVSAPAAKTAPALPLVTPTPAPAARDWQAQSVISASPTPLPAPVRATEPLPLAPVRVQPPVAEISPAQTLQPIPRQVFPTAPPPVSTETPEGRAALYSKLGLVCIASKAVFCADASSCGGRCAGQTGWCDGRSGEVYGSLEAIERANCRKAKK